MNDTEYTPQRQGALLREGEPWWKAVPNLFQRWKGPAALMWGLLGGAISTTVYRFLVVDQVQAQSRRITALETRVELIEKQSSGTFKGVCMQLTLAQQQLGDMNCPSALVKHP